MAGTGMAWMNDIVCKNAMKGWCDDLGRNPKNYLFAFILSIFMNYGFPLLLAGVVTVFFGNVYFAGTYLDMLSPVIPGISLIYTGYSTVGLIVLGCISIAIGACYIIYMIRLLGIFALIPVILEIVKILTVVFFTDTWLIGIILSVMPWMTIAVGSHFISYNIGKGLMIKQFTGR